MRAYMVYEHESTGLFFTWHGGPYIDVHSCKDEEIPFDVINVWDYEKSNPSIPVTFTAFEQRADEWATELENSQ